MKLTLLLIPGLQSFVPDLVIRSGSLENVIHQTTFVIHFFSLLGLLNKPEKAKYLYHFYLELVAFTRAWSLGPPSAGRKFEILTGQYGRLSQAKLPRMLLY